MNISREKALAIEALLCLSKLKMSQIREIEEEICDILILEGEDREFGHVSDAVWGDEKAKYIFNKLGIKVEKKSKK